MDSSSYRTFKLSENLSFSVGTHIHTVVCSQLVICSGGSVFFFTFKIFERLFALFFFVEYESKFIAMTSTFFHLFVFVRHVFSLSHCLFTDNQHEIEHTSLSDLTQHIHT